nr:hypothetical protein [Streptomyces sp. DSM 41633]
FNLVTALVARWLHRQLDQGLTSTTVAAAFSAVLFVFTVANVAIGVALAPRYAGPAPAAIYGNNLAQQITSTFDVTVCALSFLVLAVMVFTGPFAGYLVRRETRSAKPAAPEPPTEVVPARLAADSAPPTIVRQPRAASVPRIVRLKEDSTTVLAAPPTTDLQVPTQALRIQRRPQPPRW